MEAKEALKRIKNEFDENINSHVFLVETNDIEKCITDLKGIVKDLVARDNDTIKNQIDNENYLEMIIIRSEETIIKNENILELQNRIKTKPVLSDYLVYLIAPAEDMNENSANKLLKTIEEPNANVLGFLITKNADLLLPTIKSRCETVTFIYETDENGEQPTPEIMNLTKELVLAIEKKDHPCFYRAKSEKTFKENAQIVEKMIKDYYNMACNLKETKNLDVEVVDYLRKNNRYKSLIAKAKYINILLNKLTKNMNADLLLEKMFFDLKEVK